MIEGTEEKMSAYMDRAMEAMLSIAEDKKAENRDRIMAAKIVDGANDSVMHGTALNGMVEQVREHNTDHKIDSLTRLRDLKNKKKDWAPGADEKDESDTADEKDSE